MRQKNRKGGAAIEFAFVLLVLIPLLLGAGAMGVNMVRTLETIQLARDAGHMYARGIDFGQPGNKTILEELGGNLGLNSTASASSAVVTLSALTYVDKGQCAAVGAIDGSGNPTSSCTNYQKWVFTQRIQIGNPSYQVYGVGSPLTSGPTGVTINATTGKISQSDYVKKAGAVATFSAINPYSVTNNIASGLPSGQVLYIAEAGAQAWKVPPFTGANSTYSFGMF